jgi:hypothetical protein
MSPHQFFAYHFENEKYVRFLEHYDRGIDNLNASGARGGRAYIAPDRPGDSGLQIPPFSRQHP